MPERSEKRFADDNVVMSRALVETGQSQANSLFQRHFDELAGQQQWPTGLRNRRGRESFVEFLLISLQSPVIEERNTLSSRFLKEARDRGSAKDLGV
jgi:hypothetical protein